MTQNQLNILYGLEIRLAGLIRRKEDPVKIAAIKQQIAELKGLKK